MIFIFATLTFLSSSICINEQTFVIEKLTIKKPTTYEKTEATKYKKVPTKWVKITKKSN